MSELPKGWAAVTLGGIIELKYGKSLPEKARIPGAVSVYGSNGVVGTHTSGVTAAPAIIVGRKGSIGEAHFSETTCFPIDTTYFVDEFECIEPRFAWHLFRFLPLREMNRASAIPGLNREDAYALPLGLPPFPEQRRIVAKIDSLTGKSRRARDHLDHIPRLVEKYKQAILSAAFRGDLTREWRENHCPAPLSATTVSDERRRLLETHEQRLKQCENIRVVETDRPFKLPEGWDWVRAEAICGFITKGTTPGSGLMSSGDGEVPFIKVYNLTFDGTLDFTIDPTFVSNVTHKGFLGRSKVLPGDVLMNIVGPPLGKVSVVPSQYAEWNINQAIAVFRPIPSVLPAFLSRWLLTDVLTRWAVSRSKATAGQSNLTLEICRNLPVPLCSYAEQVEIVRKIDTAMSWVNRLAGDANSARKLIDHLDQSVLAKAFKGELVPQDATDEPASALLERIQTERAAAPKAKRGRTKAA
ncbi:TPA: restriction endonuclease subunit S [Burkholderia cepacia]|nr:hypothetical protein BZY94_32250 [Burkholderia territorii]HDR9504095.1 restriction endonuclease subunit S [Burkholderia cepacia]